MAAVAVVVIVADQVTKSLAVARLSSGPIHLIGPFSFALSYNSGVAFSIGRSLTWPLAVLAVVLVARRGVVRPRRCPTRPRPIAVGMILGGALGNLSDRIFRGHHGAVVDFIYSSFWPTFNVADSSIVCGSILLCIVLWRTSATRHTPERGRHDAA